MCPTGQDARPARESIGFGRGKREGEDEEAIKKLFTPEFRNRLDATISFAPLTRSTIDRVVEKFVLELEAQLIDRDVTFDLTPEATRWLGEKGYDEKFGARPLGRVIQEHIKKPLADELLFGKLENGGTVKVVVAGKGDDSKLAFDIIPADPSKKPKAKSEDDDDEGEDDPQPVLVDATPKKALPGPKEKKERPPRSTGTVPNVPRPKDE